MICRVGHFLPWQGGKKGGANQVARAPHSAARPSASDSFLPPRGEAAGGGRCRSEVSAEQTWAATDGGQTKKPAL